MSVKEIKLVILSVADIKDGLAQEHVRLGTSGGSRCTRQLGIPHRAVLHDLRGSDPATDAHARDKTHGLDVVRRHRRLGYQRGRPRAVSSAQPRRTRSQPRPRRPSPKESVFAEVAG